MNKIYSLLLHSAAPGSKWSLAREALRAPSACLAARDLIAPRDLDPDALEWRAGCLLAICARSKLADFLADTDPVNTYSDFDLSAAPVEPSVSFTGLPSGVTTEIVEESVYKRWCVKNFTVTVSEDGPRALEQGMTLWLRGVTAPTVVGVTAVRRPLLDLAALDAALSRSETVWGSEDLRAYSDALCIGDRVASYILNFGVSNL